ncbi:MAG: hypothetical protein ABR585_07450 [Gemmatimonadaceae bacterium]
MDLHVGPGPALYYATTDGGVIRLDDVADLTRMTERERAIAAAVVDHARSRIATAGYDVMTGVARLTACPADQSGEAKS